MFGIGSVTGGSVPTTDQFYNPNITSYLRIAIVFISAKVTLNKYLLTFFHPRVHYGCKFAPDRTVNICGLLGAAIIDRHRKSQNLCSVLRLIKSRITG